MTPNRGAIAEETKTTTDVVLECRDMTKDFGRIKALDGVSFVLRKGEVLGLIGDNGAGKSTLVKIIRGALSPTSGTLYIAGQKRRFRSPRDAIRNGIQCVYQESALVEQLSIDENFFIGQEPVKRFARGLVRFVDFKLMRRESSEYLASMGFDLDVREEIGHFSGGQRQAVSVMRALYFNPKILLLDEPLTALSEKAKDTLCSFLLEAKKVCPMILVTHDFGDVVEICDRLVILKLGKVSGELDTHSGLSKEDMLNYMLSHM